jgi:hypothetical protein
MTDQFTRRSMPEHEPAEPLPEETQPERSSVFTILWRAFKDRKSSWQGRIRLAALAVGIWTALWIGPLALFNLTDARIVWVCGALLLAGGWGALVAIMQYRTGSARRLFLLWSGPPVVWTGILVVLSELSDVSKWVLLGVSVLGGLLYLLWALARRSWMIELLAGDVYFWWPLGRNEEQFELLEGPEVEKEDVPADVDTRATNGMPQRRPQGSSPQRSIEWIRPGEMLWLLWNRRTNIYIQRWDDDALIEDVYTDVQTAYSHLARS